MGKESLMSGRVIALLSSLKRVAKVLGVLLTMSMLAAPALSASMSDVVWIAHWLNDGNGNEASQAAVEAAENWGTYVLTHAINDEAVGHSIDAGVKSIEHGHMASKQNLKRMKKEGVWLSMQPFMDDEDAPQLNKFQKEKYKFVTDGTDFVYTTAKKMGVKIAFGTDTLFSADLAKRQGAQLAKLQKWFTPYEALKMATCDNAELLALSGKLNPYPEGPLGVIKEGAYADMILVNGNPLQDLDLVSDPVNNFKLIMKDGTIYKNTLK